MSQSAVKSWLECREWVYFCCHDVFYIYLLLHFCFIVKSGADERVKRRRRRESYCGTSFLFARRNSSEHEITDERGVLFL